MYTGGFGVYPADSTLDLYRESPFLSGTTGPNNAPPC